jgi:hypothetical protein
VDCGEEFPGGFVVAGGNGTELLKLAVEVFDDGPCRCICRRGNGFSRLHRGGMTHVLPSTCRGSIRRRSKSKALSASRVSACMRGNSASCRLASRSAERLVRNIVPPNTSMAGSTSSAVTLRTSTHSAAWPGGRQRHSGVLHKLITDANISEAVAQGSGASAASACRTSVPSVKRQKVGRTVPQENGVNGLAETVGCFRKRSDACGVFHGFRFKRAAGWSRKETATASW